jgi:hypothetical protein
MEKRLLGAALVVAIGVAAGGVTEALAAPPSDPPGKSGEAPGHQKEQGSPAEPSSPGNAAPDVVEHQPAPVPAPAPANVSVEHASTASPEPSPRFENAAGKPKLNVPAAAEAAPETSISAPGKSGRHKLTICHKGHAITVDVHAARAHVDGHGDTYAVAGARGRATCPQSSGPTADDDGPHGPVVRTELSAATAEATRRTAVPAASPAAENLTVAPPPGRSPTRGVSATRSGQHGAVASTVSGGSLPFTGARLETLLLFGFGLVGMGLALVLATPVRAQRSSSSTAPSKRC